MGKGLVSVNLDDKIDVIYRLVKAGEFLKNMRVEKKLSLAKLSDALGGTVSSNYLSLLERGKVSEPSEEVLRALAKFYEIPEEEIFNQFGKIPEEVIRSLRDQPFMTTIFNSIYKRGYPEDIQKKVVSEALQAFNEITKKYEHTLTKTDEK
ncbi:helix-turn-helix domain-containing protein [Heliobacterium chlorum]|uniref:Helix-turn-helix domain-containing protein n=1 Tax=Heliobacterium chlorum TaxID=2698 RepID=A0ABR7T6J7_HELCL|nr:helix-turn-helix transcriptional regulator [Heliobacterium chlorum]MBC9786394.1 helix-turn-helix domain-containing protein [Heliobacterium chlorum]